LKLVFDATLGRGVMSGAARVVAVTQAERRQLLSLGVPASAIRVIPNPIDLSEFEPPPMRGEFRARLGLGDRPIVTFFGKLTPRKRVDVLVEAVSLLGRRDVALVIAGNDLGAGRRLRRLVARRGLEPQTVFTGLLSGRTRLEALADADVVAYPARDEIFGLVPLEALLAGTPVIVAGDSGCGEVIRAVGGGQVVSEPDPRALADAIRRALDRLPQARAEAMAAQRRVRELYAPDAVCAAVEAMYREIMAAKTGAPGRGRAELEERPEQSVSPGIP
jgi:phosphatidylinositol alpha-1,6-mannosyltransferase